MIRFFGLATLMPASAGISRSRLLPLVLSAAVLFPTFANAATIDFNTATGNYDSALDPDAGATPNWIDLSTSTPVGVPAAADDAYVRNGGTVAITAPVNVTSLRIGASRLVTNPDTTTTEFGGAGVLNWTGGDITSPSANGPILRVGERATSTAGTVDLPGTVNHSGGKISLTASASALNIGATGTTPTPPSVYNLMPGGTIGVVVASNGNNGINVRNGTFNMTGGNIVTDGATSGQRFLTISSASGPAGSENVATANFSGGLVDVRGGVRMAPNSNSKAYMTISGTADIKIIGSDFQLGANGTNAYAQVDMSGGSLAIGSAADSGTRRLIIGDSTGTSTGVFNLNSGTVNLYNSLVVTNNVGSKGTLTQTGGTLTVRSVETNRNTGIYDLTTEVAAIIINGPTAVFNQQNNASGTGQLSIGQFGRGRFEIQQGQANIREIRVSENTDMAGVRTGSRATLNVFGGKLTLQDGLIRQNVDANNAPTINLTGGELELNPSVTAMSWQADMHLLGTDFDPKPGATMLTNVGSAPNKPANFSLNSGTVWDLDIANGTITGADWVDVPNGAGAINGGVLNLHYIGGYTPTLGDEVRIVRNGAGLLTLNTAALTISDPLWQATLAAGGTEIHLVRVPEPTSLLLIGIGLAMLSATRRTSRK